MPTVTIEQLNQLTYNKLVVAGVNHEHAMIVADVLTFAEARGISSHGVMRLAHYLNRMKQESIKVNPNISVTSVNQNVSKMNGDQALGHIVAKMASDEAISLAKESGIGIVSVSNTSHSGAVGYYADRIAQQDMIGIIFTQADALVAPYGGKEPYLGANPITFGVPTGLDYPLVLDMSTSQVSFGKVMLAKEKGEKIPLDWALDENGVPTDDPNKVKSLQPMAGAKGYGLAILVDILAGVLTGESFGRHINPMYGDLEKPRNLGQFFIVLNPKKFVGTSIFLTQIQQMITELQESPVAEANVSVFVPGERSYNNVLKANEVGINLSEELFAFLNEEESKYEPV
ncbi:MAG: Ldh family oxidoreductase [Kurthia sp.]|nr:Ldh family oxidoreductase [Candidatus Kurthia equi]